MSEKDKNLTETRHIFSFRNKLSRFVWNILYVFLFYPFKTRFFRKWRVFVLKCFGADVAWSVTVHSTVKIWAPWNLKIGEFSCIGPDVDCYNQGMITIGANTTISQKSYLCASSHDYTTYDNTLLLKPIIIGNRVWVAADAFIGPGVTINDGAVVGSRSVVIKDVEEWSVVAGNPAKFVKKRNLK